MWVTPGEAPATNCLEDLDFLLQPLSHADEGRGGKRLSKKMLDKNYQEYFVSAEKRENCLIAVSVSTDVASRLASLFNGISNK